jgi:hypothetical protein
MLKWQSKSLMMLIGVVTSATWTMDTSGGWDGVPQSKRTLP